MRLLAIAAWLVALPLAVAAVTLLAFFLVGAVSDLRQGRPLGTRWRTTLGRAPKDAPPPPPDHYYRPHWR